MADLVVPLDRTYSSAEFQSKFVAEFPDSGSRVDEPPVSGRSRVVLIDGSGVRNHRAQRPRPGAA